MTVEVHSARHMRTLDAVPLDAIAPGPLNPRKVFREEDLAELAESIRQDGLLEPLVVRRAAGLTAADGEWRYELIAGERRLRACKLAGLEAVPVRLLSNVDDATALRLALVENLQRVDLDPIEEAEGYAALNRVCGLKQAEIAAAVKRQQPFVAKRMALLDLPEDVRARIQSGELSVAHAVELGRYRAFPAVASGLAELAVKGGWTSKQLPEPDLLQHLQKSGAVKALGYDTPFDRKVCEQCPFGAYRKGTYYGAWCLNPPHYAELEAEARQQLQERIKAAEQDMAAKETERKTGTATGLPKLGELQYGSYERVGERPPEGCGAACACRGKATDYSDRVIEICTDPRRYKRLAAAAAKADAKVQRERFKAHAERLRAAIDRMHGLDERGLAIVAAPLFGYWNQPELELGIRHAGGVFTAQDFKDDYANTYGGRRAARLLKLRSLAPADLARMLVEIVLVQELDRFYLHGDSSMGTPWTDWYLGESREIPQGGAGSAAERVQTAAVAGAICGGAATAYAKPLCRECEAFVGENAAGCELCAEVATGVAFCRACGCTDAFGCEEGCCWIEEDLCSACAITVAYEQGQEPAAEMAHA